jgi:capping protein alpha
MSEGPTAEQKMNIATYFIMSSPTGELNDVVKDVTKLVADPATLTDEALTRIIKEYNHEQMAFAPHPSKNDGSMGMVSAFGQTADGKYFNPVHNQNLAFDHKNQKFASAGDGKSSADASLNKYRAATQKALDSYIEASYKAGKVCGIVYAGDAGRLTVCISAKNVHLGNFWTGGWRSCYGIDIKTGAADLKGTIKVGVHYFEDGNVQLHANVDQSAKVNVTAKEDETGTAIVGSIAKIENDFHAHLEEMYVKMHTQTFKHMRRFYSLTKEPMKWNPAAHAMAAEVQSQSASK